MARANVDEIRSSFLSHVREEGIEYTMIGHGVAHQLAEVDPEFAPLLHAFESAHEAVEVWIRKQKGHER